MVNISHRVSIRSRDDRGVVCMIDDRITIIAEKNGVQTIKHLLLLELEELRQAIENNDEGNIIEEIQDVRILGEQYATMKNKRVESQEWYEFKIDRTMKRLGVE